MDNPLILVCCQNVIFYVVFGFASRYKEFKFLPEAFLRVHHNNMTKVHKQNKDDLFLLPLGGGLLELHLHLLLLLGLRHATCVPRPASVVRLGHLEA